MSDDDDDDGGEYTCIFVPFQGCPKEGRGRHAFSLAFGNCSLLQVGSLLPCYRGGRQAEVFEGGCADLRWILLTFGRW